MNIRTKTKRRLLILFTGFLVVVLILAGLFFFSRQRKNRRLAANRTQAMALYKAGDYTSAVTKLGEYLDESKNQDKDAEALFAYGVSRKSVPTPRYKHVQEAIGVFQRYLQLRPNDAEAQKILMQLYPMLGYYAEAVSLADGVLARDPNNVEAMRTKIRSLYSMKQDDKLTAALAVSEKLNQIAPTDIEGQILTQYVLKRLNHPDKEIIARAEKLRRQYPDDPRFEFLLAGAYHASGQKEQAREWLLKAAARTPPDADFTNKIVSSLDGYQLFDQSLNVLEKAIAKNPDPALLANVIQRLWQNGNYQQVIERVNDLDPKAAGTNGDLIAFRALSLYQLNRPQEAAPLVAALGTRTNDPSALSWAEALNARFVQGETDAQKLLGIYNAALERDPANPIIHFMSGEAYAALREVDLAQRSFQRAGRLAPSWAAPAIISTRMLAAAGRYGEAMDAARQAYLRAPRLSATTTGLVIAAYGAINSSGTQEDVKKLLEQVRKIQGTVPGEPETLHIYAALLSRTGQRQAAIDVIRRALQANPPPPSDTMLRLAAVNDSEKLGLDEELLARAKQDNGATPEVALREAIGLARQDQPQQGLDLLQKAAAGAKENPVRWRAAIAQYRDAIKDPSAPAEWIALGDANPKDLMVQELILSSPARQRDRAFWQRTIDRVKALTGEEANTWKLERARWLLAGGADTADKDSAEAIAILTEIVRNTPNLPEPRRLLALAHEKSSIGKSRGERDKALARAIDEMSAAADLKPGDLGISLGLTGLLRSVGRAEDARLYLDQIAGRQNLTDEARRWLAATYSEQGLHQKAADILKPIDESDLERDAQLADIYRKLGQVDEATKLYKKLLDLRIVDPGTLAAAADFFAAQNQSRQAQQFLARLRERNIPEAQKELYLAHFAEQHASPEEALQHYTAATGSDPNSSNAWRELAAYQLRHQNFEQAAASAEQGLKAAPGDAELQSLKKRAIALKDYRGSADITPVIEALSSDPRSAAAVQMLTILNDRQQSMKDVIEKLRALADSNPTFLPVQVQVVGMYLSSARVKEAEAVAARTAAALPNSAAAVRLLVAVYAVSEDGQKMKQAALEWRARSLEKPLEADIAIAQAMLKLGDPSGAERQLEPYIKEAAVNDGNVPVVKLYAHALIASGQQQQASALLRPLAEKSPRWREAWLELAGISHRDFSGAAAWINEIAPFVSADSAEEQFALADAWYTAGRSLGDEHGFENAATTLNKLSTRSDVASDVWLLLAVNSEALTDYETAEKGYRNLLKSNPDHPEANNNLAYLLLIRGDEKDLPEALKLSEKAIAGNPNNASFYDTLARIQTRKGDYAAAISSFETALTLDANHLESMIGLADVLVQSQRADDARTWLVKIEKVLRASRPLSAQLQQQLDHVRNSLQVQSGRAE